MNLVLELRYQDIIESIQILPLDDIVPFIIDGGSHICYDQAAQKLVTLEELS